MDSGWRYVYYGVRLCKYNSAIFLRTRGNWQIIILPTEASNMTFSPCFPWIFYISGLVKSTRLSDYQDFSSLVISKNFSEDSVRIFINIFCQFLARDLHIWILIRDIFQILWQLLACLEKISKVTQHFLSIELVWWKYFSGTEGIWGHYYSNIQRGTTVTLGHVLCLVSSLVWRIIKTKTRRVLVPSAFPFNNKRYRLCT